MRCAGFRVRVWPLCCPALFLLPQLITHDKVLVDCDSEFEEFVKTMSGLA